MTNRENIRERVLKLLDKAPIGIEIIQEGKFVFINQKLVEFSGYSKKDIIGKDYTHFLKHIHPDDRELISTQVEKRQKGERYEFLDYQFKWITKTGEIKWLHNYSTSIEFDGKPAGLIMLIDITSQKKRNDILKYYELIIQESEDLVAVVDKEYNYVVVNKTFLEYNQLKKEEIIGCHIENILGETLFKTKIEPYIDKCFSGERIHYELKKKYPKLGERNLEVNYYPIEVEMGELYVVASIHDITSQKRTKKKLQDMERGFQHLIENSPYIIILIDQNAKIINMNRKFTEITGYRKENFIGTNFFDLPVLPPKIIEKLKTRFHRYLNGEELSPIEVIIKGKFGEHIYLEPRVSVISMGEEKIIQISVKDITEQKVTEKALKKSEKKYRELTELLPDIIYEANLDSTITYTNPIGFKVFGYTHEEFERGINIFDLIADEYKEVMRKRREQLLQGIKTEPAELLLVRKDGSTFYARNNSKVVYKEEEPIGFVGTVSVIDNLVKTKEQLQKSKQKYQKLANNQKRILLELTLMNNTFMKLSNQNNIDSICKILGKVLLSLNREIIILVSFYDKETDSIRLREVFGLGNEKERILEMLRKYSKNFSVKINDMGEEKSLYTSGKLEEVPGGLYTISTGKIPKQNSQQIERTFNIEKTYTIGFALEDTPQGGITFFMPKGTKLKYQALIQSLAKYSSLIMNRILAEQQLEESREQYREAYNNSEFYKDLLAHDIANIINNIKMSIELAEINITQKNNAEQLKEFFDITNAQLTRAKNLIINIRKMSQVETQKLKIEKVNPIDILTKLIDKNIMLTRDRVKIDLKQERSKIYVAAGPFLADAFENILINGIKHNTSEKPFIRVQIRKIEEEDTEFIRLDFIDNGIGIPKELREKIFAKNFKSHHESTGMGIGLSLVKKITEAYGGKIRVEPRIKENYKKGSAFVLILPTC